MPIEVDQNVIRILKLLDTKIQDMDYTELMYYKKRIESEQNKLYRYIASFPQLFYSSLYTKDIPMLSSYLEKINNVLSNLKSKDFYKANPYNEKQNFSNLTKRLLNLK